MREAILSEMTNQNRVRLFRDRRDNGVRPELRPRRRRPLQGLPQARVVSLSGKFQQFPKILPKSQHPILHNDLLYTMKNSVAYFQSVTKSVHR